MAAKILYCELLGIAMVFVWMAYYTGWIQEVFNEKEVLRTLHVFITPSLKMLFLIIILAIPFLFFSSEVEYVLFSVAPISSAIASISFFFLLRRYFNNYYLDNKSGKRHMMRILKVPYDNFDSLSEKLQDIVIEDIRADIKKTLLIFYIGFGICTLWSIGTLCYITWLFILI